MTSIRLALVSRKGGAQKSRYHLLFIELPKVYDGVRLRRFKRRKKERKGSEKDREREQKELEQLLEESPQEEPTSEE
jgi:hypothetical protein